MLGYVFSVKLHIGKNITVKNNDIESQKNLAL